MTATFAPNSTGLIEALVDLKDTFSSTIPVSVGLLTSGITFEAVSQGDALYLRSLDGKIGKAVANVNSDKATVIGFARTSQLAGQLVQISVMGIQPISGLTVGSYYFLSDTNPGAITAVVPALSGSYVTRVGQAASSNELAIELEPPIFLSQYSIGTVSIIPADGIGTLTIISTAVGTEYIGYLSTGAGTNAGSGAIGSISITPAP
jgi:hypothetical protein